MYLNDWKDTGFNGMVSDFGGTINDIDADQEISQENWKNMNVLLASYATEDYGGDAFILFIRDGKLYEVNAWHCSCYGLGRYGWGNSETQWEPEETTVAALRHRLNNGSLGRGRNGNVFAGELHLVLDALESHTNN